MTLPVAFRKKLNLKPGERVLVEMRGNEVIILKNNWLENLHKIQKENRLYLKKHGIKPLTDEKLDRAIDDAAEKAATERYRRSLE
jgi:AbrB family looped-hinge helix DNA binding protein